MADLQEMIERTDIVDYISKFVGLREKGGEFWGLSPFKDEKTPSFSVRRETGSFYDFSSGIGGNVFTFIKHYNKCSSVEAAAILKAYLGISDEDCADWKYDKLEATNICKRFRTQKVQKKYEHGSNNVYAENCMDKYEKRADKLSVWENEGISRRSLDKFQVYYDSFSDRLVYPIRNLDGKIVNIGGRTLDPEWKEKKLRKYTYFSGWNEMDVVYGLYENSSAIREAHEIILFEGCKSVLIADTWDIHSTGALLTSHLNPLQMKILAKLGVDVVFALDKDVDIRKDHNINKLKNFVNVSYLYDRGNLLDNKDAPVDKGCENFQRLYEQRVRFR